MSITDAIPGVAEGKLIIAGIALAGIAIPTIGWTVTAHTLKGVRAENKTLTDWQSNVRVVTSHAAGLNGLLRLDQVPVQIAYFGAGIASLKASIATQNTAVDRLASDGADRIAAGNAALAQVEATSKATEKAVSALKASAAGNTANDGACVPSAAFLAHSGDL